MRITPSSVLALVAIASVLDSIVVLGKKPNRPKPSIPSSRRQTSTNAISKETRQVPVSRRRPVVEDEDDFSARTPKSRKQQMSVNDENEPETLSDEEDYESGDADSYENDLIAEDEDEDDLIVPSPKNRRVPPSKRMTGPQPRGTAPIQNKRPQPRRYEEVEDDEDFSEDEYARPVRPKQPLSRQNGPPPSRRGGPPQRGRPGGNGGRLVQYNRQPAGGGAAATLTKGWEVLKSSLPDPSSMKDAALSGISAVQQTTSTLSANIYREVKGLTSSELEQVMLKATSPDDTPVKGKHVERLVGVTYQISSRYDIYDAVLRKLWSKMAEKDWRTTIKSLYILHRFSADGAPEHAPALKARLRELRRTRDPKRKDKFFNSKQLLAGDSNPANVKFRAFMARYAHYVLLRAQCFGGMFEEISTLPKQDKKSKALPKPITSTSLRNENLEAAAILFKAGLACQLKDGEECENTAIAAERVASDLIGLTTAVAIALNRALKADTLEGLDLVLIKKWCQLYKDTMLPQTRAMIKKTSPKLDAYGLFLPSRMGTTVSPELLEKGLNLEEDDAEQTAESASSTEEAPASAEAKLNTVSTEEKKMATDSSKENAVEEEGGNDDEYEYDDEEYYEDDEL